MPKDIEYHAELHNYLDLGVRYIGKIYSDTRGRFLDGEIVTCSITDTVSGDILTTKNTRYKLVAKED